MQRTYDGTRDGGISRRWRIEEVLRISGFRAETDGAAGSAEVDSVDSDDANNV